MRRPSVFLRAVCNQPFEPPRRSLSLPRTRQQQEARCSGIADRHIYTARRLQVRAMPGDCAATAGPGCTLNQWLLLLAAPTHCSHSVPGVPCTLHPDS